MTDKEVFYTLQIKMKPGNAQKFMWFLAGYFSASHEETTNENIVFGVLHAFKTIGIRKSDLVRKRNNKGKKGNHPMTNIKLKADPSKMLFQLGQIVATPGALAAAEKAGVDLGLLLFRHVSGDWGSICVEDKMLNDESVTLGNRILSAYPLDSSLPCEGFGDNCLWIITEADRSVTTFLLPEEY